MLLVYPRGVRIIVHAANLIHVDWNKKSQGLWMQDFPWKDQNSPSKGCGFESDLIDYLSALKEIIHEACYVEDVVLKAVFAFLIKCCNISPVVLDNVVLEVMPWTPFFMPTSWAFFNKSELFEVLSFLLIA